MTTTARRERRQAELAHRRDEKRARRSQSAAGRSLLVPLSLAAVVLGVAVVFAIAVLRQDAPSVDGLHEPSLPTNYALASGRTLGQTDAPVTIELWSDYQCPACGRFATTWEPPLIDEYIATGDVRLVYRDFAFIGEESIQASIGARCAEGQGKYWQYHDYLFANQHGENKGGFATSKLRGIAQAVGLDLATFDTCRADAAQRQAVVNETATGRASGVDSTPTLAIDGQLRTDIASYGDLQIALNAALANAAP